MDVGSYAGAGVVGGEWLQSSSGGGEPVEHISTMLDVKGREGSE